MSSTQVDKISNAVTLYKKRFPVEITEIKCYDDRFTIFGSDGVPPQTVDISENPILPGNNSVLTASGAETYTWSPVFGLDDSTGSEVIAAPDSNITYTVTGNTSASECSGFADIAIYVYCDECQTGNVIFDTDGNVNHGCTNRVYRNNANCNWLLYPIGASEIFLNFKSFDIKPGDEFKIYDGQDETGTLLYEFQNNNLPVDTLTAGNSMFIVFTSDATDTGQGFQARFWTDISVNIEDINILKDLIIYPNPAKELINIEFSLDNFNNPVVINLFNTLGKLLVNNKVIPASKYIHETLSVKDFPGGIYYLQILTETGTLIRKIIIE